VTAASPPVSVSDVLSDAAGLYRLLLPRSVVVAGSIFAVVALGDALAAKHSTNLTSFVSLLLGLVGGLLVQGALVAVVRDLHEGRKPPSLGQLYDRTSGRLGTLVGASLLYGVGVAAGLFLLIVPGLIAAARWALIVPLVVIEGRGARDAFRRSNELVRGQTGRVLGLVVLSAVISGIASVAITSLFAFLPSFPAAWIGGTVAGAFAVPFQAYVLTVLYYRLTEPGRPLLAAA
jgi:Membrane domain of glycerophosphoryl diester phosphodiesterase